MDKKKEYMDFIYGQMKYFDEKSIEEKKKYYLLSTVALCANAIIPVFSTFSSIPSPYKQIVAILSAIAAVANGLNMVFNSSKNWKHYRDSFTDLEAATRAYATRAGVFRELDETEAFELYYNRCESVLKSDRDNWDTGAKGGKG